MPSIPPNKPLTPAPRPVPRPAPAAVPAPASPKILEADLHVKLRDADGFRDRSAADITGRVAGTIRIEPGYVLARLREAIKSDGSKTIKGITWDAAQRAYVVKGAVHVPFLPDPTFTVTLKPTKDGRLAVEGWSWADCLARLLGRTDTQGTLRAQLARFADKVAIEERDGKFLIDLLPGMAVPFGAMGGQLTISEVSRRPEDTTLDIDAKGGLLLAIKQADIKGGTQTGVATRADARADEATLDVKLALHEDRQVQARIAGSVAAHFDADELAGLVGTHKDVLGPIGHEAAISVGDLVIEGRFADKTDWQTRATGRVDVLTDSKLAIRGPLTAVVDGKAKTTKVEATGLTIAHPGVAAVTLPKVRTAKTPEGFDLQVERGPEAPYAPRPATGGNRLGLVVGGHAFAATLHDVLDRATDHVHGETFEFSPGTETRKLITHMAERAAGLRVVDGEALLADDGVAIRVLTDREPHAARSWAGRSADALKGLPGEAWAAELRTAIATGTGAYAGLDAASREMALANLARNLEIRDNAQPVLRTDHRKTWIVDGAFGMAGGMNLDDPMLTTLHDVMVPTVGPAVRDLQAEWLENWREVGGPIEGPTLLRNDASIAREGARFGDLVGDAGSTVQVLVTDDRQNEIEEALVRAIDGATDRIRLEHAYFTHDRVLDALAAAVRRGVDVDVIIPEASSGVFYAGNRAEAVRLLETAREPGAGKVEVTFFQQNGDYFFHNHTKALAVDGKELIVGSGNLDQRGMAGTFASDGARILFNRELDYRIADPAYVARFEREIFDRDKTAGEGKGFFQKVAEGWAFAALPEAFDPFAKRFQAGEAADAVLATLARELHDGAAKALDTARGQLPLRERFRSDKDALAQQDARVADLRTAVQALVAATGPDARAKTPAAIKADLDARAAAIAATLPEGRARDVARKGMDQARDAFLEALAKTPAPGWPTWFAERLVAQHAYWGLKGATLATRDRLAGLMAQAPAAFDAQVRQVLVPDAKAARLNEAMDFLF